MEINRNNYEAYFIDYLEGTLDERLVNHFLEFIKLNPDLKEELDLFESVSVMPENISFQKKDTLYKEKYDSEKEFNNTAVASVEGDISTQEKLEFELYLAKHPEKRKELALFAQTKLVADQSISFNNKNKLYRKSRRKIVLYWSARVAAILILAFAVFTLFDKTSNKIPVENQFAEVKNNGDKQESVKTTEVKTKTIEEEKVTPVKLKKETPKPVVKNTRPKKIASKSINEITKNQLQHEDLAVIRIPIDVPSELRAITASLNIVVPNKTMGTMYLHYPDNAYEEEMLIGDKVKEKFNLGKITKAGLNLVTSISNERFTYHTDQSGNVTEYKYDSRLLAFSLPGKKDQSE